MSESIQANPVPRRSTLSADYQRDWEEYYSAVAGKPPRDTLVRALDLFEREDREAGAPVWRVGVDIGCGEGRDTREMLRRAGPTRWSVMASDSTGAGLARVCEGLPNEHADRVFLASCSMEALPKSHATVYHGRSKRSAGAVDLVNASFALPFCTPESFPVLWAWIRRVLKPGGRFAGQFFGDRDEWACVRPRSHFTRAQVEQLLQGLVVEHLEEIEKEGDDATGKPKYHHVFHVVARKPPEKA